jgi:hypothetical protein
MVENLEEGGSLDLSGLTSIPEGFNPTVGGSLYLSGLTSIPEDFNPTVGGWLDLSGLTSIPEGFNPTVGGWLDLSGLTSIPEGFNPTVGGSLYLSGLTSIPECFNPTVGGSLDLSGLTSIPECFNPTVGGSLDLSGLTSIPEGFNPTVGGSLYLSGLTANYTQLNDGDVVDGKYVYCDGILTHIKRSKKVGEYTYYVGKIPGANVITNGKYYAHCKSISEGIADIAFKEASERGSEQFEHLTADSELTVDEAKSMYRIITGACRQGTEQFVSSLGELKEKYTLKEIYELTKGQYGFGIFEKFYEEKINGKL